jgi:hypothetical protein
MRVNAIEIVSRNCVLAMAVSFGDWASDGLAGKHVHWNDNFGGLKL